MRSPPLPRARRCHTSGGPGAQQSLKLRPGRCSDPRGAASPSRGLPAGDSERCQGVRHYRGRAARSRARGSRGTRVPAKLERGGRVDPRPGAPGLGPPAGRRKQGRPNQVGTRGKPRASRARPGLAPGRGALGHREGTRDGWAENSPAAEPGSAEAASSRCAPARPPARPRVRLPALLLLLLFLLLLLHLLLPGARGRRARGSESSRSAAPRGWRAPVAPTHLPMGAARVPPPSPPLCASLIPPRPLSPSPHPSRVPSPPSAPANPSSGRRLRASPRAPLAHPGRPAAARRLAAPRRSRRAKWLLAQRLETRHKYVGTEP